MSENNRKLPNIKNDSKYKNTKLANYYVPKLN